MALHSLIYMFVACRVGGVAHSTHDGAIAHRVIGTEPGTDKDCVRVLVMEIALVCFVHGSKKDVGVGVVRAVAWLCPGRPVSLLEAVSLRRTHSYIHTVHTNIITRFRENYWTHLLDSIRPFVLLGCRTAVDCHRVGGAGAGGGVWVVERRGAAAGRWAPRSH